MSIIQSLQQSVMEAVEALYGQQVSATQLQLQRTRSEFEGQWTLVTFPLLKISRKSPEVTAQELGSYLLEHSPLVSSVQVVKGFLNLTIAPSAWLGELNSIRHEEHYGHVQAGADAPFVMVEYSSPNTNKPLHLGHIRNNLLGYSIAKILEATGNKVFKTNIVNDRGIHICKSMLAWMRWGNGATPESTGKKGDHLIGDFYVLFDKHYKAEVAALISEGKSQEEAEAASPLMAEARALLRRWEEGDEEVVNLWRMMNSWVYAGFDETYRRLGVSFDEIYYESQTYLLGKEEVLRGLSEGLFVQDPDGSVWADFTSEGLDRKILLRSDGTSVYITQDIGTAKMRFDKYPIDKMVYVVGNEQEYHFKVLSLLLDRLGYAFGKGLVHFSYGMVELPNGKMKSREGTVVDADDLMDEMTQTALTIAHEQGKASDMSPEEAQEVARRVGLGSLKYFILKVDPRKNMVFNPEESIDFNGNTGSFIQYTYARICSVIRRAEEKGLGAIPEALPTDLALSAKEISLISKITDYPEVVQEAGRTFSPAVIASYVYDLVKEYNQFYHDHSMLHEPDASLRSFRLALSSVVARTVASAFDLLGIEMSDRM